MPGISLLNKVIVGAGFCASLLAISEWISGFGEAEPDTTGIVQSAPAPSVAIITHPPGSDEARIAEMMQNSITCTGLALDLRGLGRQDTAAEDSTSGQPATYLEASIHAKLGDQAADFQAIGNGRGPAGEGQAFTALLTSVQQAVLENFSECKEG